MPFARWLAGERPVAVAGGASLVWKPQAPPSAATYATFRAYLAALFTYANTGSLASESERIAPGALQAGDFFVTPGSPGHAVLVLDVARSPDGRVAVLVGQGFMPAQSFHLLRAARDTSPWYVLDANIPVATPFWKPFPWSSLRRLND